MTDTQLLSDHRHISCHLREFYDDRRFDVCSVDLFVFTEVVRLAQAITNSNQRHNLIRGMHGILTIVR